MPHPIPLCSHLFDDGRRCAGASVSDQRFCAYHLHHRVRLMRMAQARARAAAWRLELPPLEDMFTITAAVNRIVEAVACDMLDLKRAHFLLSAVRSQAKYLLARDKWPAAPSLSGAPSLSAASADDRVGSLPIDLTRDYGLPPGIDLAASPDAVFPPPDEPAPPPLDDDSNLDYRPDYPVTPEMIEVLDISNQQGSDAAAIRGNQLERNRQRRELRSRRKRYAEVAARQNLRQAAEKLAARKLAEQGIAAPAPPQDFDAAIAAEEQKMRATKAAILEDVARLDGRAGPPAATANRKPPHTVDTPKTGAKVAEKRR